MLSTASSPEEAERLARSLLDARLAACVNLVPGVRRLYRWRGAVEDSSETLLLIKTSRALFPRLSAALAELHSYEVPEVLALSVAGVAEPYLSWLASELEPTEAAS